MLLRVPARALLAALAFVVPAVLTAYAGTRDVEPRRSGLTRAQAERLARDGAFYDRRVCPRPRYVECVPAPGDAWECTVEFPGGGVVIGDPQPDALQTIVALC